METNYDVIIIGAGVAGGLIANKLAQGGKKVLILESGEKGRERVELVGSYISAPVQSLGSPYNPVQPPAKNMAPGPESTHGNYNDYYVQDFGPDTPNNKQFKSTYERRVGGSTWHWLGNCPRLLPNDFKTKSLYGFGKDWPISYDDLEPWYCEAEKELGVSGDHEELNGLFGAKRSKPFPMNRIWPSYSDLKVAESIRSIEQEFGGYNSMPLTVFCTPQARNSQPYDGRPVCAGNSTCVPICPIGAKYDASVHIQKAQANQAHLMERAVVTKVWAPLKGEVTQVSYENWEGMEFTVTARVYVVAANSIETPKLLLMSGIGNSSDQVGRNLMDHPQGEGLCVSPEPLFPFRVPPTTSGIDKFRDGAFRKDFCAFRMSLGNDGGGRSKSPATVLSQLVQKEFGATLRQQLNGLVTRQFRISFLAEMLPSPANRVILSDKLDDAGIPRPRINFQVDDYTMNGFKKIAEVMRRIFQAMGSKPEDITVPDNTTPFMPAGHIMGTCRMGNDPADSVVDADCRSHDHPNLFIAGSSVFPTGGTANPTLTLSAISLRMAAAIEKQLNGPNS